MALGEPWSQADEIQLESKLSCLQIAYCLLMYVQIANLVYVLKLQAA